MRLIKSGICPETQKQLYTGFFKASVESTELRKSFDPATNLVTKSDAVTDEGLISGYASTWNNSDAVGDIIRKGAFKKTLKERQPRVLWQHSAYTPIGKMVEAFEDNHGLFVAMKFNLNIQQGREAFELYKSGDMDSFSIGAMLEKYSIVEGESGKAALDVQELRLYEVSAVTFPANEKAVVTAIKGHLEGLVDAAKEEDIEAVLTADSIDDVIAALTAIKAREEQEFEDFVSALSHERDEIARLILGE